jgi:hypothetical protein
MMDDGITDNPVNGGSDGGRIFIYNLLKNRIYPHYIESRRRCRFEKAGAWWCWWGSGCLRVHFSIISFTI